MIVIPAQGSVILAIRQLAEGIQNKSELGLDSRLRGNDREENGNDRKKQKLKNEESKQKMQKKTIKKSSASQTRHLLYKRRNSDGVLNTPFIKGSTRKGRDLFPGLCSHVPMFPCSRGFSLLEMIVAVFVFSIIVTVATSSIVSILKINKKSQAVKTVINNLNLSLEGMIRDIRFSTGNFASSNQMKSLSGGSVINIADCPSSKQCSFNAGDTWYTLKVNGTNGYMLIKLVQPGGVGAWTEKEITAPEVNIKSVHFDPTTDGNFKRTLILVSGSAGTNDAETDFALQTTATRRND